MSRRTRRALALAFPWSLLAAAIALADLPPGAALVQLNLGGSVADSEATGRRFDGAGGYLSGDFVGLSGKGSLGVTVAAIGQEEELTLVQTGSTLLQGRVRAVPILVQAKAWAGGTDGNVAGFVGAGVGIHWSEREIANPNDITSASEAKSGLALGFPFGVQLFVGKRLLLNATYQLWILDNGFYESSVVNTGTLGIGLLLGS